LTAKSLSDKIKEKQRRLNISKNMSVYVCPCGYRYDPVKGDPDNGIAPGTAFEDLPNDFECPVCGLPKDAFNEA
jgi:rubredoxin